MSKLLCAGARRYAKSRLVWATFAVTIVAAFLCGYTASKTYFEEIFVIGEMLLVGITISWLVGRESGEGVLRNKIVVGHTKGKVLASELLLGIIFSSIIFLTFTTIFMILNEYLLAVVPIGILLKIGLDLLAINIVFAMMMVTINCLFSHRTIVMVISILFVLGTTYISMNLRSDLKQEEYHIDYETELLTIVGEDGTTYTDVVRIEGTERKIVNRDYVHEPMRTVYKAIYNIFPYGHIAEQTDFLSRYMGSKFANLQMVDGTSDVFIMTDTEEKDLNINLIYDFVLIGLVAMLGYVCFRRKDLR